jgi:hypothetical protein
MLPDKFAVIFDGRSAGDKYFVALFATFTHEGARKQILLCFSPILDEIRCCRVYKEKSTTLW